MTYQYNIEFRKIDIENNIKNLIKSAEQYSKVMTISELNNMFNKELQFYNTSINDLHFYNDEIFNNIYIFVNKNVKKLDRKFIIPRISYSLDFYNCSFMDIISNNFSKYKTGFSGTVSMILPEYNIVKDNMYNFNKIKSNSIDNSIVISALLGFPYKTNESLFYLC